MIKKIAITGITSVLFAVTGYMNAGDMKKAIECVGDDVKIEYLDAYYCGSDEGYEDTYASYKGLVIDNKLSDVNGMAFGMLAMRHDKSKREEIRQIFVSKYNIEKGEFKGSEFDSDFMNQFDALIDIANIELSEGKELIGETMNERIYNLIK